MTVRNMLTILKENKKAVKKERETGKILESVFFVLTYRMSFLCHKATSSTSSRNGYSVFFI